MVLRWLGDRERIEAALSEEQRAGLRALWRDLGFSLDEWSRWPSVPPVRLLAETTAWERETRRLHDAEGWSWTGAEAEAARLLGLKLDSLRSREADWGRMVGCDSRLGANGTAAKIRGDPRVE